MNANDIEALIALASKSEVRSFEFHEDDCHLSLTFPMYKESAAKSPVREPTRSSSVFARSPGMGVIRLAHPQQREDFIPLGTVVSEGQVLAFLQVGDLLEGVVCPKAGVLGKALVGEGDLVGFADPIFEIE